MKVIDNAFNVNYFVWDFSELCVFGGVPASSARGVGAQDVGSRFGNWINV